MPRMRLLVHLSEDELRDRIFEMLRNPALIHPRQVDELVGLVEQRWQPDRKRDKRIARIRKAKKMRDDLDAMIESGIPRAEAKERLKSSVEAFDKFVQRNRYYRRPRSS